MTGDKNQDTLMFYRIIPILTSHTQPNFSSSEVVQFQDILSGVIKRVGR